MEELIDKLNSMLNNNPTRYIKTESELIEFINQPCTKQDLTCFLNKLLEFEEYEYACIVRDKIKSLDASTSC